MNARFQFSIRLQVVLALIVLAGHDIATQGPRLRVLFSGYVDTKPRVAFGIIDGDRMEVTASSLPRYGELSPDGTLIAFDTCKKSDRGLNVMRVDGSDERRLVDLGGDYCVDIRWSRDGTQLSYGDPLDRQLHVVDVTSGTDTPLQFTSPATGWHSWSPAGDRIAFELGRGGSRRIDVVDVKTWRTRQVVGRTQFGACEVWAPDWSPVRDRLVFTTCKNELYSINVDRTGLLRLADSAYAPRWAPDGASIFFLNVNRLMRVASGGGPVEKVGTSPYHGGPFSIGQMR